MPPLPDGVVPSSEPHQQRSRALWANRTGLRRVVGNSSAHRWQASSLLPIEAWANGTTNVATRVGVGSPEHVLANFPILREAAGIRATYYRVWAEVPR